MKSLTRIVLVVTLLCGAARVGAGEPIVAEGVVDAPSGAVWNAWATTEGLASWLAPHADIDLRIGGLMRATYDPNGRLGDAGTIVNRVLAYEPERMLSIRVEKAPAKFPFPSRIGDMWTVMYFQPTSDGRTSLRIVGMGFGDDDESQKMRAFFLQGNAYTLTQLQKRFAR